MDEDQKRLLQELFHERTLSFVKKLFLGSLAKDEIFPYPTPSVEERQELTALLSQVDQFCETQVNGAQIDREEEIPSSVIQGLAKLGVLGLTIPKKYGGLGLSQYAYCRVVERIARSCSSTALFVNAHQSIGLKALLLFGTAEQKAEWLPALAKGEKIAAFSLTEPNAGSDAAAIETKAIFDKEKGCYYLTGTKQWTTNGSLAHILTVMAKTAVQTKEGVREKITAFLVTPDMPGFKVKEAALKKVGMRGTKTSNLIFDKCEVPEKNILGPIGGGLKVCLTVLDFGRCTFGAACLGASKLLLEKAFSHAKSRYQFKKPLAAFPLVKKKLAKIGAYTFAMEATTYLTALMIDRREEDVMLETAILKVFASEALWDIIYETMQIFGGKSFFIDEPLERLMRDSRLNMIGEGANEVLQVFIAAMGLRELGFELQQLQQVLLHPFHGTKLFKNWKKFKENLFPASLSLSPELKKEASRLQKGLKKFYYSSILLLFRYKEGVVEKELLLDRIARAAICLYTSLATLSLLDLELKKNERSNLLRGKLYCTLALDELEECLKKLKKNRDEMIEKVSDEMAFQ